MAPINVEIHNASRTRFRTKSFVARSVGRGHQGVTTEGTKLTTKNIDENTWFAAPNAASAVGSPSLPTQSVSTVPTRGRMRKLRTAGTASFVMVLSSASPRGRTRFFPVSPPTTL